MKYIVALLIAWSGFLFTGCQYFSRGDVNAKQPRALAVVSKEYAKGQAAYNSVGECTIYVSHNTYADGTTSGTATVKLTKDTANNIVTGFMTGLFGLLAGLLLAP